MDKISRNEKPEQKYTHTPEKMENQNKDKRRTHLPIPTKQKQNQLTHINTLWREHGVDVCSDADIGVAEQLNSVCCVTTIEFHSWHNNQSTFNRRRRVYENLKDYRECKCSSIEFEDKHISQLEMHVQDTLQK